MQPATIRQALQHPNLHDQPSTPQAVAHVRSCFFDLLLCTQGGSEWWTPPPLIAADPITAGGSKRGRCLWAGMAGTWTGVAHSSSTHVDLIWTPIHSRHESPKFIGRSPPPLPPPAPSCATEAERARTSAHAYQMQPHTQGRRIKKKQPGSTRREPNKKCISAIHAGRQSRARSN